MLRHLDAQKRGKEMIQYSLNGMFADPQYHREKKHYDYLSKELEKQSEIPDNRQRWAGRIIDSMNTIDHSPKNLDTSKSYISEPNGPQLDFKKKKDLVTKWECANFNNGIYN